MEQIDKTLAMIEVAEKVLENSQEPILIYDLLDQVANIKDISLDDTDSLTRLYTDITLSAKFVFVGDDKWALKDGNLDFWDKDGYAFLPAELDDMEADDDFDFADFELTDETNEDNDFDDEDLDEEAKEEATYIDDIPLHISTDDDDIDLDDSDFDDDDKYNEIMDEYEDMYED